MTMRMKRNNKKRENDFFQRDFGLFAIFVFAFLGISWRRFFSWFLAIDTKCPGCRREQLAFG